MSSQFGSQSSDRKMLQLGVRVVPQINFDAYWDHASSQAKSFAILNYYPYSGVSGNLLSRLHRNSTFDEVALSNELPKEQIWAI